MNRSEGRNHIAEGLSGRLRSLVLALDRLDRLESGSGDWFTSFKDSELPDAAAELTLRAIRTASDPINFQILTNLSQHTTLSLPDLLAYTSLKRLPLSERLNDLVQVGLVIRLIDTDHAQITAAGEGLVQIIRNIMEEVIQIYTVEK